MGYLTVIMGCMFAQKTTELLKRIRRYESIGYRSLVVNYASDTRYGVNCISSHDIDQHPARPLTRLGDLTTDDLSAVQVLVIDEAQFFPDLVECVTRWCDTLPIHVVVCGLDGDAGRRPFGRLLELIPHAEEVMRLSAYCSLCRDATPAHFSLRLEFVPRTEEQIAIGGKEKYMAVCRQHYLAGQGQGQGA
jgi:thymidine kinase